MLIDFEKIIKTSYEEITNSLEEQFGKNYCTSEKLDIIMIASCVSAHAITYYHSSLSSVLKAKGIDVDSLEPLK